MAPELRRTGAAGAADRLILVYAVLLGVLAGLLRAWGGRRRYGTVTINHLWLVPIALLPQFFVFFLPATREGIPDWLAALALVSSQTLLLVFVWLNRHHPPFWMLGLGLSMNLGVILANGGLMPIGPSTVNRLAPRASVGSWSLSQRLGSTKDIVLAEDAIRLQWLADRFISPQWLPPRSAFSLGDLVIAGGAFWMLWALGGPPPVHDMEAA